MEEKVQPVGQITVCPNCGLPLRPTTELMEVEARCSYCGWSGSSNDLISVIGNKLEDDELTRLRLTFIEMAKDISPRIGSMLIRNGFISSGHKDLARMTDILSKVSRAMFQSLVESLAKPGSGHGKRKTKKIRTQA